MADNNQNNPQRNFQDIKKEAEKLNRELQNLGGEYYKDLNAAMAGMSNNLEDANKFVKNLKDNVGDLKNVFGNLATTIQNTLEDIEGMDKLSGKIKGGFKDLQSIAQKLQQHKEEENVLTVKELQNLEKKARKKKDELETQKKLAEEQIKQFEAQQKAGKLNAKDATELKKLVAYQSEIEQGLQGQVAYLEEIVTLTGKEAAEEAKIQKTLGLTGYAFKGIAGALEKIGFQSKYFEKINEELRKTAKEGSGWAVLGKGITETFKGIGTALADPLTKILILSKIAKGLWDIGMGYSKSIAETGKNYAMSAEGAKAMVNYTKDVAANAHGLAVNNHSALEATNQLNDAFGTTALLSADLIEGQVELTDVLGLQADEAAKISEFALLQGKTQEEVLKDITGQTKGLANNRKVIAEVAKTSGQLAAFYQNSPGLIAKAVVQAQKLGMSLEQTKGISDALLDIESSLANEYEAEALIGRDLNLNRARQLALEGDVAGAAEEVLKNIKGSAEFSQMNRIQQDALAKSLGMSADDLAKSLIHQEKLSKLSNKEKQILAQMRKDGQGKLADEIEAGIVQGKSFELSKAQVSASQKFEESVTKIKDGFSSLMAGPMGAMVDGLAAAVGFVSKIFGYLGSIPGAGTLGSLISVVIGGGALIAGGMLLYKMLTRNITNMFKGKPSGRQGDELHVIVDNPSGGGGGGGYGPGGRGRRGRGGKGGRRGGRGRSRGGGGRRGKYAGAAGVLGSLGVGSMLGDDSGMIDDTMVGADIGSDAANLAGKSAPKGGGGKGGSLLSKAWSSVKGAGSSLMKFGGDLLKGGGGLLSKGWNLAKQGAGWVGDQTVKLGRAGLDAAAGPVKSALKVVGKFLGPILAAVSGVANVAGTISDAKARKAAGEKVDTAILGKDIMKGAAYPIASLLLNLIPGVGTAMSLADAALGAFGLSPIQWLSDNLIDWLPDDTFKGLGDFALGEQKAMAAGGIVTGPTNALVGEAGAEAVIPLREFYAKIDELINAVKQGGNIYLDGAVVSTKLQSPMAIATRRTG